MITPRTFVLGTVLIFGTATATWVPADAAEKKGGGQAFQQSLSGNSGGGTPGLTSFGGTSTVAVPTSRQNVTGASSAKTAKSNSKWPSRGVANIRR
jgi:hypothetical protein